MAAPISQKEYLKKYIRGFSSSEKRKKKRKKEKHSSSKHGIKIVDHDSDLKNMPLDKDSDDLIEEDEAPLVAEIIDERPQHVKVKEQYDSSRWKTVGYDDKKDNFNKMTNKNLRYLSECNDKDNLRKKSKSSLENKYLSEERQVQKQKQNIEKDDAFLPETEKRNRKRDVSADGSFSSSKDLSQKKRQDTAAHRQSRNEDHRHSKDSNPRHGKHDSDRSPSISKKNKTRHDSDSDLSPPRVVPTKMQTSKLRHDSDSDLTPPKRIAAPESDSNEDNSPERSKSSSKKQTRIKLEEMSDSDLSPKRKVALEKKGRARHDSEEEPVAVSKRRKYSSDSDLSPVRERSFGNRAKSPCNFDDVSPSKQRTKKQTDSESSTKHILKTPKNEENSDSDLSPPRTKQDKNLSKRKQDFDSISDKRKYDELGSKKSIRNSTSQVTHKSKNNNRNQVNEHGREDGESSPHRKKENFLQKKKEKEKLRPSRTLSGMTAGLQRSSDLKEETKLIRQKEEDMLKKIDDNLSGRNAETIIREKDTGRKRNLKEEEQVEREKEKQQAEKQEKYAEWGKGLKQKEDQEKRIEQDLYEMSKPLARYQDDSDLEIHLKEQEREGDPMLEFINRKKKKQKTDKKCLPSYKGPPPPPNRFAITPGYRWDGVDRSNGFEKRYFEKKTSKVSHDEEAYKWSVQDM